jgi:hypothetical protein
MNGLTVHTTGVSAELGLRPSVGVRARREKGVMPDSVRQQHQAGARYQFRNQLRIRTDLGNMVGSAGDDGDWYGQSAKAVRMNAGPTRARRRTRYWLGQTRSEY